MVALQLLLDLIRFTLPRRNHKRHPIYDTTNEGTFLTSHVYEWTAMCVMPQKSCSSTLPQIAKKSSSHLIGSCEVDIVVVNRTPTVGYIFSVALRYFEVNRA